MTALFLKLPVNRGDGFILLPGLPGNIVTIRVFHQADQFRGVCGEGLLIFNSAAYCVGGGLKQSQLRKINGCHQIGKLKITLPEEGFRFFNRIENTGYQLVLINGRIASGRVYVCGIVGQSLAEGFHDADIIDN